MRIADVWGCLIFTGYELHGGSRRTEWKEDDGVKMVVTEVGHTWTCGCRLAARSGLLGWADKPTEWSRSRK